MLAEELPFDVPRVVVVVVNDDVVVLWGRLCRRCLRCLALLLIKKLREGLSVCHGSFKATVLYRSAFSSARCL